MRNVIRILEEKKFNYFDDNELEINSTDFFSRIFIENNLFVNYKKKH
jgi:hypothetical protein